MTSTGIFLQKCAHNFKKFTEPLQSKSFNLTLEASVGFLSLDKSAFSQLKLYSHINYPH